MQDPQQTPAPYARFANNWRRYLRFWGSRAEADVDDELRFHFEMRVRDYVARGMSEAEARAAVMHRLGDVEDARAECVAISSRRQRNMTRALLMDALVQDVKYTLRSLSRQKGWTVVAILTLALGIGASTAVFSVVNSLVLHPIPYPDADRLALAYQEPSTGNQTGISVTISPQPSVVRAWLEGARSFESLQAYRTSDVTLEPRGQSPVTARAAYVLPGFPQFAGEQPMLGRMFTKAEVASREPVVLLSEATWRTRFGADTSALGASIIIDDKLHTIIGVFPGGFQLPRLGHSVTDVWMPLDMTQGAFNVGVIGRLRPGVAYADAMSELDTLAARSPSGVQSLGRLRAKLVRPGEMVSFRESLTLLSGAVALVLLIACTNVAHLLLARAASRQRELAIRMAIGAGRGRLFRQLLTETLVLTGAGCLGGLAIGWMGLRALIAARPESLATLGAARVDGTVLLAAIALSLATGIGFGLIAAVQSARHSTHESLKAGSLSASHVRHHNRLRSLLVVSEMALSATLLVGASLLIRSVIHLQTTDVGFEPRGLYSVNPGLPESRYRDVAAKRAFYDQLAERIRALPGVEAVTIADAALPGFNFTIGAMQLDGAAPPPAGTTSFLRYNAVAPGFFRTIGMRIVEGGVFSDSTRVGNQLMINEGFAKKYWPGRSAVGRRVRIVRFDGKGDWLTIVGVVADAATGGLTHERSDPVLYLPGPEYYSPDVIVRTKSSVDALPALRSVVSSLDPRLPPPTLTSIEDAMANSAAQPRFTMMLLVSFTVLALVLAAIGLYGVMAYAVAQRTREIGIRIALGATRRNIARGVVSNGVLLAVVGSVIGLAGAWWATKLVEQMLYGVTRTDPVSFLAGGLVLIGTAVLACIVPMNRAASVDPLIAMRAE